MATEQDTHESDLDSVLGYDADHDDPRQYCIHGTFIGSWWGPDYLCPACEQGIPLLLWTYYGAKREVRRLERHPMGWLMHFDLNDRNYAEPYSAALATEWTKMVLAKYDEFQQVLRQVRRAKARVRFLLWKHGEEIKAQQEEFEGC